MKETKKTNRRKFLGAAAVSTAAGFTIPKKWVRPVVESVVLPAHAQTSTVDTSGIAGRYAIILSSPGTGSGTCTNTYVTIPATTNVEILNDGTLLVFFQTVPGAVSSNGVISVSSFPVNTTTPDGNCTTLIDITGNVAVGNITNGNISLSTVCDQCTVSNSSPFTGTLIN